MRLDTALKAARICIDEMYCTNSIGVAIYPQDAKDFDTLLECGDQALYYAKRKKGTYAFYEDIKNEIR